MKSVSENQTKRKNESKKNRHIQKIIFIRKCFSDARKLLKKVSGLIKDQIITRFDFGE